MGAKPREWWVGIELGMEQVEMGTICGNAIASKHIPLAFLVIHGNIKIDSNRRCSPGVRVPNITVGQRSNNCNILLIKSRFPIQHAWMCMICLTIQGVAHPLLGGRWTWEML